MLNNEFNLIMTSMQTYFEFDRDNFVVNAQSSLTGNADLARSDINLNSFCVILSKTISDLDNMPMDAKEMVPFFATCSKGVCETLREEVPGIVTPDVLSIKPNYLNDFVTNIGLIIDRTLKGVDTKADIDRLLSTDMVERVKKQMVKTTLPYIYDAKKIANIPNTKKVVVSPEYFQNIVIPFLKNSENTIAGLRTDAEGCVSVIARCAKEVEAYKTTLSGIKNTEDLSPDTIKKVNYVTYNAFRALIDVVSFLTYMTMRKINTYTTNIQTCTSIYSRLSSVKDLTESGFNDQTVFPTDTHNVCEDLIQGRSGLFDELAIDIYDFNNGLLMNSPESPMLVLGKDSPIGIDSAIDSSEYNTKVYDEAAKMYTIINKGLDIISQYSDDYLMVFDDIKAKAGFEVELLDRFKTTVELLDDISEYTSATNLPTYSELVYFKMLHEVKDYPANMQRLADIISDCKARIDMLSKRFNDNIQGEYANAEAVNELKIFMEEINNQLVTLTNKVGAKFMLRLKNIGIALEQMNILRDKRVNDTPDTPVTERVSFNDEVCEDMILTYETYIDSVFEDMHKQFMSAMTYKNKGALLVFEDGENNNGATQTTTTTNNATNNTNNNNNGNNNGGQSKSKSFLQFLSEWFDKMQQKLVNIIESKRSKDDQAYLANHKQELLAKDYTHLISDNVYDYEAMQPYGQMQKDLNTLVNRINTSTMQKLNTASDADAILKEVFANTVPQEVWSEGKVADAVTAYYKFGKNTNAQRSSVTGPVLKTLVSKAIEYCDGFYTNKINDLRKSVETIKKNMEGVINTMVTESVVDVDFMTYVLEDGENNANTNNNNNGNNNNGNNNGNNNQKPTTTTTTDNGNNNGNNNGNINNGNNKAVNGMADKINTVNKNVTYYCSGIITAAFDRYNDYMVLLKSIVPDNGNNNNNNNNQ